MTLLDLPWAQDSITETKRDAIEWLYWLDKEDWRSVAEVIDRPFLQTLEADDVQAIREMTGRDSESYLGQIERRYPAVSGPLRGLAWPQPPFTETELDAIESLYRLAREDRQAAATVAAMPWVQDGITIAESEAINRIYGLSRREKSLGATVISLPWVQDDITLVESRAIQYLDRLAYDDQQAAAAVIAMPWIRDEITYVDFDALRRLRELTRNIESTAVIAMPWIHEGITKGRADALKYLSWISSRNADAAAALIAMPFLKSLESRDTLALRSLSEIAVPDPDGFRELMSHPRIKDGITDEETKIVAVLGGRTYTYAPGSAQVLLAETGVYIEERLIELPHTGKTLLAVIRTQDKVTSSMDNLEHAVRSIERFMGEPFPINYLALLFYDMQPKGAYNNRTNLLMAPDRDLVDGPDWHAGVIAHEVAHWYWRNEGDGSQFRLWITEGSADLLRIISQHERVGRPLDAIGRPCRYFESISEIEKANPPTKIDGQPNPMSGCRGSLGQRFFLDLYLTLGDETFRQAFRALYLKSEQDYPGDGCGRPPLNFCRVEAAFKDGASAEVVAKVDEVIDRWYYGK